MFTEKWCIRYWLLAFTSTFTIFGSFIVNDNYTLAQLVPDKTLGDESSSIRGNVEVKGKLTDLIESGAIRDNKLFHSFNEFNIDKLQRVYFANPSGIENIFSRVTGNNPSNIFGTLGVDGNANLFLLNPNGIVFGSDAQLDIAGSFLASTGESLRFGNGFEFSATNPEAPPLLNIGVPLGVQYGANQKGAIALNGDAESFGHAARTRITNFANLVVGKDFTLAAGNLDLRGQLYAGRNLKLQAQNNVRVRDSATQPFIAAARNQLLVQGNQDVDIFALNHPNSGLFSGGDMVLRSANTVGGDAHYWSGGSFQIEQLDGSLGNLFSPYDPIIRSQGDVSFNNYFGASLHILAGGSVNIPGAIIITEPETGTESTDFITEEITLSDGKVVSIDGNKEPTLDVRAGIAPSDLSGSTLIREDSSSFFFSDIGFILFFPVPIPESPVTTNAPTRADINIGTIAFASSNVLLGRVSASDLLAGRILLTNQYKPNTSLDGNIQINANTELTNSFLPQLKNLAIQTGDFNSGGFVDIDSRGSITLNGIVNASAIPVFDNFFGNGGDVTFLADSNINFNPGSFIASAGLLGGNIKVKSNGTVSIEDSGIANLTATNGQDKGGNLSVSASESINISNNNGSGITNLVELFNFNNFGFGSSLDLQELRKYAGTGLATTTLGTGNAGDLTIDTRKLVINNQQQGSDFLAGAASVALPGSIGNGGNLTVNAYDSVEIDGKDPSPVTLKLDENLAQKFIEIPTGLTAAAIGSGNSGDLTINTGKLTVRNKAAITNGVPRNFSSDTSSNIGQGGKLTVNATDLVELSGFAGLANGTVGSGDSGKLTLNVPTGKVIFDNGSGLAVDTLGSGKGGILNIEAAELYVLGGSRIGGSTTNKGAGGTIKIEAGLVEVRGKLDSGDISVPSGIFTSADPGSTGPAGDLNIITDKLTILEGGVISAQSQGENNAGKITINISKDLITRDGSINTFAEQSSGGAIDVTAEKIRLRGDSDIRTNVFSGAGGGGNINLAADSVIAFDDSDILAFARDGKGGDITFQTPAFFGESFRPVSSGIDPASLDGNGRVDVNASGAVDGLITLPNVDFITNSLQELPENTIDTDSLIASSCIVRSNQQQEGSFTVTGSGGLPTRPGDLSTSAFPNGQIRDIPGLSSGSVSNSSKPRPWKTGDPIVEPTGVYRLPNGELVISRECS
ncbi:MAG: filamentous hemagglutinin N-terminal domain-containing protein [Cyanobacteria bacterium P01_A01_bin.68]